MKFYFNSSETIEAISTKDKFVKLYGQNKVENADIIVPIGGDGFLLKNLHDFHNLKIPFFGVNYGSVGFLMNSQSDENLETIINNSQKTILNPLQLKASDKKNKIFNSIAYNEVSIMRQTHQAAKINIKINGIERMNGLICDGVLVSTAAGSTAYNLSAHGSIIPLDSNLLALTPISAFRPRRWRGALLSEKTKINLEVTSSDSRPASITADHNEFRDITKAEIHSSNKNSCVILFDNKQSMEERILKEQFYS
ncbi:MAG: NAD kinase [Alphaproteobacteria bacterium]|jgi:NAD+ kinase|nr:NAD kinase [Alphaproteobacteria bacterium]